MNEIDAALLPDTDLARSPGFRNSASDEDFRSALEVRSLVDTATGIIMGRHECDRDRARAYLQRTARTFEVTVLELARGLVSASGRQ